MTNVISFPALGLYFEINRATLTIGNFSIYWYGVLIALGLALAVWYGMHECKRTGFDSDHVINMLLIALPASIICARAYYVIFNFDMYKGDFMSIFDIRSGGIAIYGAVIGAFLTVYFYCRKNKLCLGTVLDLLAVGLLIGQAVGRWGNFVNGEAFGAPTSLPWAMTIENNGRLVADMVHPTFLYESLWNAIGIILLILLKKRKRFEGELFSSYMVWYGLGRFMIEGLRADSLYIGAFRISQLVSICILIAGLVIITKNFRKKV